MTLLMERPAVLEPTLERQEPLLEVRRLTTEFKTHAGPLSAVNNMSFSLPRGRVLAIIGESGSGKSALLRTILGIQAPSARVEGEVLLNGVDLLKLSDRQREDLRGGMVSMVFQDPMTALDPIYTVEQQLVETVRRHSKLSGQQARIRARELLELVQIPSPERRLQAYPFELSGGMRQRLVIAMALASTPKLLLADEPTTALDVTVQGRILRLLSDLQRQLGMSVIFVTHDLAVAAQIADDVIVMYAGRIVETGTVREIVRAPSHPYTRGLLCRERPTGPERAADHHSRVATQHGPAPARLLVCSPLRTRQRCVLECSASAEHTLAHASGPLRPGRLTTARFSRALFLNGGPCHVLRRP